MEIFKYIQLVLVGFGASFVQRVSGFGLGIFVMMFLPYFMPTYMAATVSTLFSCGTTTYNTVKYRKDISYKTAFPIVASSLVTIPIAVYFSTRISSRILEVLLGAILVVLSVYFLFFGNKLRIKPNLANGMITGALGGVLGGLFSTNGPPIVLYLSSATKDKSVYFATTQFVFCISNIYSTITRAVNGIITWEILCFSAVGLIGCVLGDFVGKKVFDKLDSARLKQIIYIGMILSGIIMLI